MIEKSAASIGIIGGADGPTAVLPGNSRKSLTQKISYLLYLRRRNRILRNLHPEPHTLEEVLEYAKTLGYSEVSQDSAQYRSFYRDTKAALVMQHAPALLGTLPEPSAPHSSSPEEIQKWIHLQEQRRCLAGQVDDTQFPMELHLLIRTDADSQAALVIEKLHHYLTVSASGRKRNIKHLDRTVKAIYRYYGVAQTDIENQTARFQALVGVLSTK